MDSDIHVESVSAMIRKNQFATTLFFLVMAVPAFAHEGEVLKPHDLPSAWALDPGIVIPLILSAVLYLRGIRRSKIRVPHEIIAYALGWLALIIALLSPMHPLGEALFSVHMAQHEILMLIAAPLLVVGRPIVPYLFALPMRWRQRLGTIGKTSLVSGIWRCLTTPNLAWALHGSVLWLWHIPAFYERTLSSDSIHIAQHASFLFSALLFWWAIIHGRHGRMGYGASVVYLFTTAIHTSILGALLTVAPSLWYPIYAARTAPWGLAPLEDQQLAGLIMWIPCGVIYLVAALVLFFLWIRESDLRFARSDHDIADDQFVPSASDVG
jgi:putative membrane protein